MEREKIDEEKLFVLFSKYSKETTLNHALNVKMPVLTRSGFIEAVKEFAEQSRITEQGELFKKELEILRKLNERRSGAMHAYDIADWPVVDLCLAEIFTLEEQLANLHPITE